VIAEEGGRLEKQQVPLFKTGAFNRSATHPQGFRAFLSEQMGNCHRIATT
jgi:hypothetical protein